VPVCVRVVSGSTPRWSRLLSLWYACEMVVFEGSVFGQARRVR